MTGMRTLVALTALFLTGCAGDGGLAPTRVGNLAIQRALWTARAITSYDYDLTSASEWFPPKETRVEVRNGLVARIIDLETGEATTPGGAHRGLTIDSLFTRAAEVEANDELIVEVRYDANLNYVRLVSADHPQWADDSWWYSTRNLVPR